MVVLCSLVAALGGSVGGAAVAEMRTEVGAELWVDGRSAACSDSYSRLQAVSSETPWCSVVRAAAAASAGDTVRIRPARYVGSVRPASGTAFVAAADGVTIDAAGTSAAVKL